jgi:hypothetical protein
LVNDARAHEIQYRKSRLKQADNIAATTASDTLKQLSAVLDIMHNAAPGGLAATGYCAVTFVGTSYNDYIGDLSKRLTKNPLSSTMSYVDNFNPRTHPFLDVEVENLASRMRDNRYGLQKSLTPDAQVDNVSGAAIIQNFQRLCFGYLGNFTASPEAKAIPSTFLLPFGGNTCPDPLAPQDVWDVLNSIQQAADELSDGATCSNLLMTSLAFFKPRLAAHYLLSGQNSLPALLYVRRMLAADLADAAAAVFCNPFMAAVEVLRRVISTSLSASAAYGVNHSTMKITTNAQAQAMIARYQRSSMPLAQVSKRQFGSIPAPASSAIAMVGEEITKVFALPPQDPGVLLPNRPLLTFANSAILSLGPQLPSVMNAFDGVGPSKATLSTYLAKLRDGCLLLGLIESCVSIRLKGLQNANASLPADAARASVPAFWFAGFREYGTIAAYALGQPPETNPEMPSEANIAQAVVGSLLAPAIFGASPIPASVNFPPPGLSDIAKPYPANVGTFWGWGAETITPNSPAASELITSITGPQCAFAGENAAVMGALGAYSELQAMQQLWSSKPAVRNMVNQLPGGVGQSLRNRLQTG